MIETAHVGQQGVSLRPILRIAIQQLHDGLSNLMGCPVKRADFKVTWLVDSLRYQQRQRNSSQRPLVQAYCASRLAESTIETGRCQVESRTFTHSRSVCDRTDERLDTPRQSLVPALPRRQPITVESIVSSRHLSHYKKKISPTRWVGFWYTFFQECNSAM